jgi:multidrug resistance efflux pump
MFARAFVVAAAVALSACGWRVSTRVEAKTEPANAEPDIRAAPAAGDVRATGTIQAVRAYTVQVPQLSGQNQRITLVKLAPNGTKVNQGDLLAEFDRTQQAEAAREAQAKFEDLSHQVRQKEAQNKNEVEKRSAELKTAEAALAKAEIQLSKGPVLSDIDRKKNEVKAASARAQVESLKKIDAARRQAEAAQFRVLQLQTERQQVALQRAQLNAEKLVVKAPIAGMVALETLWRSGSMGFAQEGDQLWTGQGLLKIFDPGEMEVRTLVGEPDGGVLQTGSVAIVHLDAYPDAVFRARFHSASPVATTALGSPIKNFVARYRLEQTDTRLLPDLSAAVIIKRLSPAGAQA